MSASEKRTIKARKWIAAGCVLGAAAILGGALMSAQAAADPPVPANVTESLSAIRQNAPAVARAIAADPTLRKEIGAEKWPQALHRLAEFSKNTNPDYKEALRIIGDTVPRVKSPVARIKLDGDPSEWSGSIPPPDFAAPGSAIIWDRGSAAVVRHDRLYLMAGLRWAAEDFALPDNELRVTMDCKGDQAWDVCLSLSWRNGRWMVTQMPVGFEGQEIKTLPPAQGSVGTVAEIAIAIGEFVPLTEAKPIWTLHLESKGTRETKAGVKKRRANWITTRNIPVFNEDAKEGVAAWPYVRTFLCLCADRPLEDFELTAAAIAIMSSTMYWQGDEEVRQKIRVDNAEFLELARSIDAWQSETGTEYRLRTYPLEAQLAWAARIRQDDRNCLETSREPGKNNDLENYYWASTSVETLKNLRAVAIRDGLADAALTPCSEKIDKWVRAKQVVTFTPGDLDKLAQGAIDPRKRESLRKQQAHAEELQVNSDIAGYYRNKPVAAFGSHHSETNLKQIETRGNVVGSCGQHTSLCVDLMRSLGIASHRFRVYPSRRQLVDHAWPARYDPARNLWLAYQAGRKDKEWWYFFIDRRPVFTYASDAGEISMKRKYTGPRPFPLFFCRELQGFQVKTISQTGIPTNEVREWMLTPGL